MSTISGYRLVPLAIFFVSYWRWVIGQNNTVCTCTRMRRRYDTDVSPLTHSFWNTTTSARLNSLVTPSQVTSLIFNPHSREILSSHGFPDNQLSIWTYPTLNKVIDITQAHEFRVLHSCISPDGTTVATVASDENLKFWKVFDLPKKTSSSTTGSGSIGSGSKGHALGEGKNEHDVGRRGRTGLAIR